MEFPGIWKVTYYILRTLHMFVNNIMAIPAYTVWFVLLTPLRLWYPKLYWRIESILFKALLSFVVFWTNSGGYKIIESGDDLSSLYDKPVLLLINHQSTADIPCVMSALLSKNNVTSRIMWIMDYIFMYTNFGWISLLHGDFFIEQGKKYREQQLIKLREHLINQYLQQDKRWIVLFPEGGFLYKRRKPGQKFAEKNNLPILEHCTLPRLGAMSTIVDTVGGVNGKNGFIGKKSDHNGVEWIVDMTLLYPKGEAIDMPGICIGWWKPRNMLVHYRAYPMSSLPTDMKGRTKWLYDRYVEKEQILENNYDKDTPLDETDQQARILPRMKRKEVPFDYVWFIICYVFYAVSAYIFWLYVYSPLWSLITYLSSFIF
ncbi:Acyl-CoA:lysophosphatidylglycerol acyltransferase 1 [Mactra antiquata]